jgi:hypothetical protein
VNGPDMRGKDMMWFSYAEFGDRRFDVTRRWLPAQLSGADRAACLTRGEAAKLSQIEFGAYTHLLGCLEESVTPTTMTLTRPLALGEREAYAALSGGASTELGHLGVFRETRARVNAALGFPLALLPEARRVAAVVLGKHPGAALLLTSCLHAIAERHALLRVQDDATLDALARQILAAYWQDASRHSRRIRQETVRVFQTMALAEKDDAIDHFAELVIGIEALLSVQARFDVDNLRRYIRRTLTRAEEAEVLEAVMAAKRYAFVESGLTHSTFRELFSLVATRSQRQRVEEALDMAMAVTA